MPARWYHISERSSLDVLVLGGTGHLGAAIARRFAQAGHKVTATGRSNRIRPNLDGVPVQILSGDDHDARHVARWIAGKSVVIDAATPYPVWTHTPGKSDVTDHACLRTRQILNETRKAGAAFIHISSFTTLPRKRGVLGQIRQGVVEGLHRYFQLKAAVERDVRAAHLNGLPGCVINPATCFGPYDMKPRNQTFIPMLLRGQVKGLANATLNAVDVRDVADVTYAAQQAGFPDRQIPVFGHNVSLAALSRNVCALRDVPPPRLQVPKAMGVAGFYWMETAMALAGRRTPWPSLPMMLLEASYPAAPSPAQVSLNPQLRPLDQTLADAVAWYESVD